MNALPDKKLVSPTEASEITARLCHDLGCDDVAIVRNPSYLYAPLEIYPLPPKILAPIPRLAGVVKDMDGTTTTTEPLCLHSLEWMVRQVTNRTEPSQWEGLDHTRDYPHVIGNSTTKHVEYLLTTYGEHFNPEACLKATIAAAVWTLSQGRDPGRRREVRSNLGALGLGALLDDADFQTACADETYEPEQMRETARALAQPLIERFRIDSLTDRVRAAVDIYYMRYHMILNDIADGNGARRAEQVLGSRDAHLIEPMPGVAIFLAAVKGWLGEDLALFGEELASHVREKCPHASEEEIATGRERLAAMGKRFAAHPAPIAVVTSSIAFEAKVVLGEVFAVLRSQVEAWPVADEKKETVLRAMADPERLYDAIVTASDSSEIRLKPHRDLYSIALHAMGLSHEDLPCVIGFEDSESGVTAIRAAGVGLSVAVPFTASAGHDFSTAAHVLTGGLPEALLVRGCFLARNV